jgi:hypothetical protein
MILSGAPNSGKMALIKYERLTTRMNALSSRMCVFTAEGLFLVEASASNENKMSDGGRDRASLGVEVWKSSQKLDPEPSAVRSIAWLGLSLISR